MALNGSGWLTLRIHRFISGKVAHYLLGERVGLQTVGLGSLEKRKLLDHTGIRIPDRPIRAKLNPRSISRPCVDICVEIRQNKRKKGEEMLRGTLSLEGINVYLRNKDQPDALFFLNLFHKRGRCIGSWWGNRGGGQQTTGET